MTKPLLRLKSLLDEQNIWLKDITLSRNEYLLVKGSMDSNLYFVKEGSMRIFIIDNGEEHTIRFAYKNSFITALDCFLSNSPSKLYIQAIRKTELQVIDKKSYIAFLNSSIELIKLWQALLEQLVLEQMDRELDLLISSPAERYKRVLERSPQLFQEIPSKYIASYLRMTPETLSRLKKS